MSETQSQLAQAQERAAEHRAIVERADLQLLELATQERADDSEKRRLAAARVMGDADAGAQLSAIAAREIERPVLREAARNLKAEREPALAWWTARARSLEALGRLEQLLAAVRDHEAVARALHDQLAGLAPALAAFAAEFPAGYPLDLARLVAAALPSDIAHRFQAGQPTGGACGALQLVTKRAAEVRAQIATTRAWLDDTAADAPEHPTGRMVKVRILQTGAIDWVARNGEHVRLMPAVGDEVEVPSGVSGDLIIAGRAEHASRPSSLAKVEREPDARNPPRITGPGAEGLAYLNR
jgi:hypothetical protein